MNYLYALMGMAMISGIITMIEISNSLARQGLYSNPPQDPYLEQGSTASEADRVFLKALVEKADNTWSNGQEFCIQLKSEAIKISTIATNYSVGESSKSDHNRLFNSCTLTAKDHRIIISYKNPSVNTYGLYSCINKNNYYCNFEN